MVCQNSVSGGIARSNEVNFYPQSPTSWGSVIAFFQWFSQPSPRFTIWAHRFEEEAWISWVFYTLLRNHRRIAHKRFLTGSHAFRSDCKGMIIDPIAHAQGFQFHDEIFCIGNVWSGKYDFVLSDPCPEFAAQQVLKFANSLQWSVKSDWHTVLACSRHFVWHRLWHTIWHM